MWLNEAEYMDDWVWPSVRGGYYCRVNHQWYATFWEAVEAVRRLDREAGIRWPWEVTEVRDCLLWEWGEWFEEWFPEQKG